MHELRTPNSEPRTSTLLYGIVFSPSEGHLPPALPPGVGGAPVGLIEEGGLGAVVSRVEPSDLTPNVERALAYAKVVEALHADRSVLPMRYGCLFEEESQVVELLRLHGEEYAAILNELDGCVEMGVRILNAECGMRSAEFPSYSSGTAYLAGRKAVYAERDRRSHDEDRVMEQCREAFAGLFVKCKAECPSSRAPDVALSFLVKRGAVESFRLAFRRLELGESARLLLSGPWPPYSFCSGIGDRGSGRGNGRG